MNIPKELVVAWAAGLFDGEGTVAIFENRVQAPIQMTDLDILEHMQYHFGGGLYKTAKQQEHHKDAWVWRIGDTITTMEFLERIYPYLSARRQARIREAREVLKANRNVINQNRRSQILSLKNSGLTQSEIAAIVGCGREHVNRVLNGTR